MILSYQTIKYYCQKYSLIEPWFERTIQDGMSYGLGPCTYDFRLNKVLTQENNLVEEYNFTPGDSILVSTIERVDIPTHICASVLDKSTFAREHVTAFNTHFDPGFIGWPTIELANLGKKPILLKKGMPICQFRFEFLDMPTEKPYVGKYTNQENKPVRPKYECAPNELPKL